MSEIYNTFQENKGIINYESAMNITRIWVYMYSESGIAGK